mmetsp:Transcript_82523/g.230104  ORF Transcript_82523/g.230104 Transcript_82523/m.230104 type:complete len:186 (-) Transcript_82523:105-662(-)
MAQPPVLVYYWIPGDSDDSEHPNAFPVPVKGSGVQLRDLRARFPLPGTYHFRFKMKWESATVWMDVTNDESIVPMFEEKIFAKVLRVSWTKAVTEAGPKAGTTPASAAPSKTAAAQGSAAAPPAAPVAQRPAAPPEDMMSFGDAPKPRHTQPAPAPAPAAAAAARGACPPQRQPAQGDDFDMLFS